MKTPVGLRAERLQRVATPAGHFAILAIDHVASFAAVAAPHDARAMSSHQIIEAKKRIVDRLIGRASAILIDPAFASTSTMVQELAASAGVILGIEDGDYADVHSAPRLLPGWDVAKAAALGVDAVKISVFFDAESDNTEGRRFVDDVATQCDRFDMPLFCEPLALMDNNAPDRRRHILHGVRLFGDLGADVLKIQFPEHTGPEITAEVWAEACAEANALSPTPWTLLSEGKDFRLFCNLLESACQHGASGFLGGRAVWGDAAAGRDDLSVSVDRLDQLSAVVARHGSPWPDGFSESTQSEATQ